MKVKKPLLGTAFSKVAFLPSPAPCSPGRPSTHPLLWKKYFGETKRFDRVQLVMLGVSSVKQVDSLLPRYACKGITYL